MRAGDSPRAFRIGPGDLEANRAGRLGPAQLRRLRRSIWINVLLAAPFQAGLVAVLVLAPRRTVLLHVVVAALVLVLTAIEIDWVWRIRRAIRDGSVERHTGPVTPHGSWLVVRGERSRLWSGHRHITRGRGYHVYIARAANLVVAMEPESGEHADR